MGIGEQLLREPRAKRNLLVELKGLDGGTEKTLYFSEGRFVTGAGDTPAHTAYDPRISLGFSIRRSMFRPEKIGGESIPSFGEIVLDNADGGLDHLKYWKFDGQSVSAQVVGSLQDGTEVGLADAPKVFDGVCEGDVLVTESEVRVKISDDQHFLRKNPNERTMKGLGPCLEFDGVDDSVSMSSYSDVDGLNHHTLAAWVRLGEITETHTIMQKGSEWLFRFWEHGTLDMSLEYLVRDQAEARWLTRRYWFGTKELREEIEDKWVHVAATFDGTTQEQALYINGKQVAYVERPGETFDIQATGGTIHFARWGSAYYEGDIGEIGVFNYAKTEAEIRELYQQGFDESDEGLVLYCPFDDNSGSTLTNTKGTDGSIGGASWGSSDEGEEDLRGAVLPVPLGICRNVPLELVDPFRDRHRISTEGVLVGGLFDGGDEQESGTDFELDTDTSTIKMLASPSKNLTADVAGSGVHPGGLSFDGVDDFVAFNGPHIDPAILPAWTLEFWVRLNDDEVGWQYPVAWGSSASNSYYFGFRFRNESERKLQFLANDSGGLVGAITDNTTHYSEEVGVWSRIGLTYKEGTGLKLYRNGVLMNSNITNLSSYEEGNLDVFGLGALVRVGATNHSPVDLSDVVFWNHARTLDEIREGMFTTRTGDEPGLVFHYPMTERTGSDVKSDAFWSRALYFDGTDDYIDFGDFHDKPASQSFTVEWWGALEHLSTDHTLVSKLQQPLGGEAGWALWFHSGSQTVRMEIDDGSTRVLTTTSEFDLGFRHVAAVVDREADELRLYVDGDLKLTNQIVGIGSLANDRSIFVGRMANGGRDLKGHFHQLRMTELALTAEQIQENAAKHLSWGSDEEADDFANGLEVSAWVGADTSGTMKNHSSLGGDGTITGATLEDLDSTNFSGPTWIGGPSSPALLAKHVADRVGTSTFDFAKLAELHRDLPYQGGYLLEDDDAIEALDDIVGGVGGYFGNSRSGRKFEASLVKPAKAGGEEFDKRHILGELEPLNLEPPAWRIRVGYRRAWEEQDNNDLVTSVSDERRAFVAREFRYAPWEDEDILDDYPTAREMVFETVLDTKDGARALTGFLSDFFGVKRHAYRVRLKVQPLAMQMAESVNLTRNRLGLDDGADFLVTGFDENDREVTLEVVS